MVMNGSAIAMCTDLARMRGMVTPWDRKPRWFLQEVECSGMQTLNAPGLR